MIRKRESDILMSIKKIGKRKDYGDCKLILLAHVLDYYGLNYSVEEILGLSSGMNFELQDFQVNNHKCFVVKGRNLEMEIKFCMKNQIQISTHEYMKRNERQIIDEICCSLSKNHAPMVVLDRYYLKYLKMVRSHFAYHVVVVTGYSSKNKVFTVVDAMSEGAHEVSVEVLLKAMFETSLLKKEEFAIWHEINPLCNEKITRDELEYYNILQEQADVFIKEGGAIDQMKHLVSFLRRIKYKVTEEQNSSFINYLKFQIPLLYNVIFEQEFSGSLYRKLYFDFVRNLILENKITMKQSSDLENLFVSDEEHWRKISSGIKEKVKFDLDQIDELAYTLEKIIYYESEIFHIIKGVMLA